MKQKDIHIQHKLPENITHQYVLTCTCLALVRPLDGKSINYNILHLGAVPQSNPLDNPHPYMGITYKTLLKSCILCLKQQYLEALL